jgi:hypothetical protein
MDLSTFSTGRESAGFSRLILEISPGKNLQKALPAMAFQRFPKFPQPLLLRFKFNLKNLLIRFSSWKNGWRLASPCCTTTQPVKKWESRANNPESPWQRIVTTPA